MNESPSIGVVVVAYRSADHIGSCLRSILLDDAVQVVVVDNSGDAKTAAICESLRLAHGRISYVDPGRNLGYGRACNLGLAQVAGSDYVAVVNPDVSLSRSLSSLVALVDWSQVTIAAGRLTVPRGRSGSMNARHMFGLRREFAKAGLGTRVYHLPATYLGSTQGRAEQLDGALLVLSREGWGALGGFDEQFELYYEDVDLCRRANQVHGCLLLYETWGEHVGGASFRRSAGLGYVALRVSRVRYVRKWYHPAVLASGAALTIVVLESLVRSITFQAEGAGVRYKALVCSIRELLRPRSVRVLPNWKSR